MYAITVAGIPARTVVTHYVPAQPVNMGRHCMKTGDLIDPGHPAANEEVKFELYDRATGPDGSTPSSNTAASTRT